MRLETLLAICVLTLANFLVAAPTETTSTQWAERAFELAQKIEKGDRRDHAFYRLAYCFARAGEIDTAMTCAENVTAAQKRVYAFAFTARESTKHNKPVLAQAAITKARETSQDADNLQAHSHVVELLLEYDRVEDAIDFALKLGREIHRYYILNDVAVHFVGLGETDRALSIVAKHVPRNWRDGSYSVVAAACATAESIADAEKIMAMISDPTYRDNPLGAIARLRSEIGEHAKAREFATQIMNVHKRDELLAAIADREAESLDDETLQQRFATEKEREAKIKLAEQMVRRFIDQKKLNLASVWVDKAVEVVKTQPMDPQISKFGSFGDMSRITTAKTLHLDIAAAYHSKGDIDEAVKHIEIAKRGIEDLDDSSGLGKFFLQAKLTSTVESLKLGDRVSAATTPLEFLKPMATAALCASLVSEGKIDEAMKVAEEIEPKQGTGVTIGDLITALVEKDGVDQATKLLTRLDDSEDIGYAYESFGKAFHTTNNINSVEPLLPKLVSDAGRVHTCIGISEAIQLAK